METEKVAENSKSRCEEQDIPFYRFNPDLKEIIPAGETDNTKLLDMVIEAKIQTKEQGLKEMTELLQMLTINVRGDASTTCTPSNSAAALSTKNSSYAERSSSPPPPAAAAAKQYHQQVPRFMITSESGEEETEEVHPNINDNYNEQLNKSMVSPAEATAGGGDNGGVANSGTDFLESESAKDELDSAESFHKHYQLKVDSHD